MIKGLYPIFDHWHKEGTVWLISDTHFNDPELWVGANRAVRDNDELVQIINSKCGKNGTLIHLGDVGDLSYISKLKARHKVLICGNHDAGHTNYERKIIRKIFDADACSKENILKVMKENYPNCRISISDKIYDVLKAPFIYYEATADNNLFDEIYSGPVMIGEKLILSHEPVSVPWAMNIHGHVHWPGATGNATHFNVCPDARKSFEPINFNQLIKSGIASHVETIHRLTIDSATLNSLKRRK